MAYDLLLRKETDADYSITLPGEEPPAVPLPLDFSPAEQRALRLLEPTTGAFAVEVVGWARQHGIPARLSAQSVIYTPEQAAKFYEGGKSGIAPGKLDWHQVGRAFHLAIFTKGNQYDLPAYERVGRYVRSKGGEWLGDKVIHTPRGRIRDTAHFEFHPGLELGAYRKSPLAKLEYDQAQARARKYA